MPDDTLDRIRFRGGPLADPAAVVTAGPARFTVLTVAAAAAGVVGDRAVRGPRQLRLPRPSRAGARVHRRRATATSPPSTPARCVLRHADDGQPFHAGNLIVELTRRRRDHLDARATSTASTSAGPAAPSTTAAATPVLEPGLVSRSGWAVHDDSALDGVRRRRLADRARADDGLDWYFFGYGHDYPAAVRDYTRFGGAPAADPALDARRLVVALPRLRRPRTARPGRGVRRARASRSTSSSSTWTGTCPTAGPATPGTASCSPTRPGCSPGCTRAACTTR